MNDHSSEPLAEYYVEAEGWAADRRRDQRRSIRLLWSAAVGFGVVALAEAVALAALAPLKTVVPYTLLVDRQTGYVQALKPLEREIIAPDRALTRSFLAQYVIARETFQIETLKDDYRKVALWSAGEARKQYVDQMQASNPQSPLASLPRRAILEVEIRGISSLSADTALVRFATYRRDLEGTRGQAQLWSSVVTYRFSGAEMSAADRLINPLGFQVVRYRRDADMPPPADDSVGSAAAPQVIGRMPNSPETGAAEGVRP